VFSDVNFHNTEEKNVTENIKNFKNNKDYKTEEKIEVLVINNDQKNIFQNIPKSKQKILNNFLEKFEDKKYFSHIEKISYRKNSSNRGLASGKKIYFNLDKIDTNEEFKRVMIHEM
jgi:hypothetical protein